MYKSWCSSGTRRRVETVCFSIATLAIQALMSTCFAEEKISSLVISSAQRWPGGGTALTLRVSGNDGPVRANLSKEFVITPAGTGARHEWEVAQTPLPPGHTILVIIPPETTTQRAGITGGVRAFVNSRTDGERIAIYRWGRQIEQLRDFSTDREDLLSVFDSGSIYNAPAHYFAPFKAISYLTNEATRIGGRWHPGLRSVVFIGQRAPDPPYAPESNLVVHWILGEATPELVDRVGPQDIFLAPENADFKAAALSASRALDESARWGHYKVAVCAAPRGSYARLALRQIQVKTRLPESLKEERADTCDVRGIMDNARVYPSKLTFSFTEDQRKTFEHLRKRKSKNDFELSVLLGDNHTPVPATAHLRGESSLKCHRKSYTLDFNDGHHRHLMPRAAVSGYYLLSLCMDAHFVHQHTILRIWNELGLFPFEFRFIELQIEDEPRGVYLLVERSSEKLWLQHGRVRSISRRGIAPPRTLIGVKFSSTSIVDVQNDYASALSELRQLHGSERSESMAEWMDLEQYLTLLAVASLFQNGDYWDELWITATERLLRDGSVGQRLSFARWDPEDVFRACHFEGEHEYKDPWRLSYCAESEIAKLILGDPFTYRLYVDSLERVTGKVTPELFQAAIEDTRAELLPLLASPDTRKALKDGHNKATESSARRRLEELMVLFLARRNLLLEGIHRYRRATGSLSLKSTAHS